MSGFSIYDSESFETGLGNYTSSSWGQEDSFDPPGSAYDGDYWMYNRGYSRLAEYLMEYDFGETISGTIDFYLFRDDSYRIYVEGWNGSDWIGIFIYDGDTTNFENKIANFKNISKIRIKHIASDATFDNSGVDLVKIKENADIISHNNIYATTADLTVEVTENPFSSYDIYFEYRETGASSWLATTKTSLSDLATFTDTIVGLTPETEYEYRAVAE